MDYQLEKCMRIISDLVAYCHAEGGQSFTMSLALGAAGESTTMVVGCALPGVDDAWMEALKRKLSAHRQREVEQNYWELSGESELSGELTLVGMMVDEVALEYDGEKLTMTILRKD